MGDTGNNKDASDPKRRLDLGNKPKVSVNPYKKKLVENPYKKKKTSTDKESSNTQNVTESANKVTTASSKAISIITPEVSIEKFFVKDRSKKPTSRRQLVSPRQNASAASDEEEKEDLYYHSDDSNTQSKIKKDSEYYPDHIHGVIDYQKRGDNVSLTSGQMNAYRFIRNHFNIPKDIELDSKFGPWSGISFEERVMRAYTLDQLIPKTGDARSFQVCTYCGEEGHNRNACSKLI